MNTQEKILYLIKIGIPIRTIAKYCNYNETHISKYAKGLIKISRKCELAINQGIDTFLNDLEVLK